MHFPLATIISAMREMRRPDRFFFPEGFPGIVTTSQHFLYLCVPFFALGLGGCLPPESASIVTPQSEVCADRTTITVGDMTNEQVSAIRASLANIKFPSPDGTVERLLDPKVKPVPVEDPTADNTQSRHTSGKIEDFWLNESTVLRVSTFYFTADKSKALQEWAVLLAPEELDSYHRGFCDRKPAKI
jgi:hypothetical protein